MMPLSSLEPQDTARAADAATHLDAYRRRATTPRPGDLVRLIADYDTLARRGTFGVLDGAFSPDASIGCCFNTSSTFRDDAVVSCSGGPGLFVIDPKELVWTGDTRPWTFWRWDGMPRAGGGAQYTLEVPIWEWSPPSTPVPTATEGRGT